MTKDISKPCETASHSLDKTVLFRSQNLRFVDVFKPDHVENKSGKRCKYGSILVKKKTARFHPYWKRIVFRLASFDRNFFYALVFYASRSSSFRTGVRQFFSNLIEALYSPQTPPNDIHEKTSFDQLVLIEIDFAFFQRCLSFFDRDRTTKASSLMLKRNSCEIDKTKHPCLKIVAINLVDRDEIVRVW